MEVVDLASTPLREPADHARSTRQPIPFVRPGAAAGGVAERHRPQQPHELVSSVSVRRPGEQAEQRATGDALRELQRARRAVLDARGRQLFVQQQRVRLHDAGYHGDAIGGHTGAQLLDNEAHREASFFGRIRRSEDAPVDTRIRRLIGAIGHRLQERFQQRQEEVGALDLGAVAAGVEHLEP